LFVYLGVDPACRLPLLSFVPVLLWTIQFRLEPETVHQDFWLSHAGADLMVERNERKYLQFVRMKGHWRT
jgi:hypothetical protein